MAYLKPGRPLTCVGSIDARCTYRENVSSEGDITVLSYFFQIKMKVRNTTTLFIRFFFILSTFINVVKAEGSWFAPTDHCYHCNQTEIQLVVSIVPEDELNFYELEASPKQKTDYALTPIDFSSIHKLKLLYYNCYVLDQLKTLKRSFTPNLQLASILQKKNIWHQSSDEDPLVFATSSGNLIIVFSEHLA